MKAFIAFAVCIGLAAASVVVTELEAGNSIGRQEAATEVAADVSSTVAPAMKCTNATVDTKDCGTVIVTRLPFLFNFRHLSGICSCEDGALNCDRGAGSSFFQRFQIPALRLVYNANCKCKCPSETVTY